MKSVSESFSFKGFSIVKFLKGNKEFVKTVVALVIGVNGFLVTGGYVEAGLALIVSKGVLDLVDYFTSRVDNSE